MKTHQRTINNQNTNQDLINSLTKYFKNSQDTKTPPFPLFLKDTAFESLLLEFNKYKKYQQNLHQKELESKNKKIDELNKKLSEQNLFMLNIAQNILDPLNGILGFVDLMINQEEELLLSEKKRYFDFIIRAEDSLVQYIDYISNYTKLINNKEEGQGFCRTKHLMENLGLNYKNIVSKKYHTNYDIKFSILNKNSDYFIQLSENLLHTIWIILIEYLVSLMKSGELKIKTTLKNQKLQLLTFFTTKEYLNKPDLKQITRFLDSDPRSAIKLPHFGIPVFIAKKHLEYLKGKVNFKIIDSKNIQFLIEFPIPEVK